MNLTAFLIVHEKNKPDSPTNIRSIGVAIECLRRFIVSGQKAHDMGVASLSDSVKIYHAWSIHCCVHEQWSSADLKVDMREKLLTFPPPPRQAVP